MNLADISSADGLPLKILSKLPIPVCISETASHEILYLNRPARGLHSAAPRACFELLGLEGPCAFCPEGKINTEEERLWHESGGRTYKLRIGELDWEGVSARIEYLEDVSAAEAINSLPAGISVYSFQDGKSKTDYFSDGVLGLCGYSREEYAGIVRNDAMEIVCERDRDRVFNAVKDAMKTGNILGVSYRILHKNGRLVWIHLSGRRIGPPTDAAKFYTVLTSLSPEARLFQNMADEAKDSVYVIDKQNHDLLYSNDHIAAHEGPAQNHEGQKCYSVLSGRDAPCESCCLENEAYMDGHEFLTTDEEKTYAVRMHNTEWNGVPACVKHMRDVTEEINVKRENSRLEQYFQTMIANLPGGAAVFRFDESGLLIPEFISEGFAAMLGMSYEEAWEIYKDDAAAGVHPDDEEYTLQRMRAHLDLDIPKCETIYRLKNGAGGYTWVKNTSTLIRGEDGISRIYAIYSDMTEAVAEQERVAGFYNDTLLQHHQSLDPNLIIAAHCNVTRRKIIKVTDRTGSRLLETFGDERTAFFTGFAQFITKENERAEFLEKFLSEPLIRAFAEGKTKEEISCFVKLPQESVGRYVHIIVNLLKAPDSGDIIGVLSVLDVTERHVSQQILHRLANTNYDYIGDFDVLGDCYHILYYDKNSSSIPPLEGVCLDSTLRSLCANVVPRDQALCDKMLDVNYMRGELAKRDSYSFHYGVDDEDGRVHTKRMIIFYIDQQLERVCLARTDITESTREQQGLLNALAYAFELMAFIDVPTRKLTLHTRSTVLGNLAPYERENFETATLSFLNKYAIGDDAEELRKRFSVQVMLDNLKEKPGGYEFVHSYSSKPGELLYKQINVLWGDESHSTICLVRADVTEMLTTEREIKRHLEDALKIAQEANRAKTDFLSAMSHDIRTPMNAIIGMTELALASGGDPKQVDESLAVIKSSSEHLKRLTNNILDMSRIESGRFVVANEPFNIAEEAGKAAERYAALAEKSGLKFFCSFDIRHGECLGDAIKIHQILDNLIGNAMKFTPEGGRIELDVTELEEKNENIGWYRFTVSDNGIGMSEEVKARLFEPFFRADDPDVRQVEGSGLGLSIVKSIVDYKGGIINVESEPGEGTRIVIDYPMQFSCAQEELTPEECGGPPEKSLSGVSVLLVEDHPVNQLVAMRMLEKAGAKVAVAANGQEGLLTFQSSAAGEFDAICMDVQMPVMNGYEAARRIRACCHPDAGTIPIIAMTANAFAEDIRACMDAGMNAHIAKPVDPKKLYNTLYGLLCK